MGELVAKGEQELAALVEQVPEEVLDYIVGLEERVEKAEEVSETNEPEDTFEKALGELDPEIAKRFVDQAERLEKAEKLILASSDKEADAVWVSKARVADGLIDKPEDFGPELREVAAINPDLADSIMSQLQTASERVAKATLFNESGHAIVTAGSAEDRIHHIAKAAVDADPKISLVDAELDAWEANPDLYDEHVADRRRAIAGGT